MEVESSHNARLRGASGPPLARPITMSHLRGITTKSFRHFRHLTNHVPKRRDAGLWNRIDETIGACSHLLPNRVVISGCKRLMKRPYNLDGSVHLAC